MVVLSSFFRRSLHPSLSSSCLQWNHSLWGSSPFQYYCCPRAQFATSNPKRIPSSSFLWLLLPLNINSTHNNLICKFYGLEDEKVPCIDRSQSNPKLDNDAICLGSSHGSLALANPIELTSQTIWLPPLDTLPFGVLRLGHPVLGNLDSYSALSRKTEELGAIDIRRVSLSSNCRSLMKNFGGGLLACCNLGNQRHKSSLVRSSGTTTATTYPKSFCEWLAGIIDGGGSLQVNNKGHTSLEITMGLEDIRLLRYVQHMLGGSIKMRSGAKAYRYRLRDQFGMTKLMNCINGHIQHSPRLVQLHRVCQVHDIPVVLPITLDAQSSWFAGFFDANGTIGITMNHQLPQLSIHVTSKHLQDVESYKVVFGGNTYFDSGRNGYYEWSVQSPKDVAKIVGYFKSTTWRSRKSQRFFLIDEYYRLYDLKAFEPSGMNHKAWLAFLDKWNNLVI